MYQGGKYMTPKDGTMMTRSPKAGTNDHTPKANRQSQTYILTTKKRREEEK